MPFTRRELLSLAAASTALASLAPRYLTAASPTGFYDDSIIIDGLGFPGGLETEENSPLTALEIEQLRDSGLTALNVTVGTVGTMNPLEAFEKIVRSIARWEGEIAAHSEALTGILSVADIRKAKQAGRTGLIYGLQDGVSFEDDLERLATLHQVGVRIIQPIYNRRNLLGDGCMEPANAGLSRDGVEAIERMNELGILVDLSHSGRRTAMDAIAASKRPVSFTHSGADAVAPHPRHRTDEEIRAVAESGGVMGIFIMPYLAKGAQPTAADVLAHIDHVVNVAGEDHVSIGTDGVVSPTELTPEFIENFHKTTRERRRLGIAAPYETETGYLFANDLNTPRRFETMGGLMLDRGYSEERVQKILGGNLLRVFDATWTPTGP